MRRKKFYTVLTAVLLANAAATSVFAAPKVEFGINTETDIGRFEITSSAKNKIAIEILKASDAEELKNLTYKNIGDFLKYACEIECDEEGKAVFTYKLTFDSGNYRAIVSDGSSTAWTKDFYFISGQEKLRLMEDIEEAYSDSANLCGITEKNAGVLNLDLTLYNELKQNENEDKVYKLLIQGEKPKTLDKYRELFQNAVTLCTIFEKDADDISDLLVGDNAIVDISDGVKKLYKEILSDDGRKAADKAIAESGDVLTLEALEEKFGGLCVYYAASEKSYLDFESILENGKDVIGEELYNAYKALSGDSSVLTAKALCKGNAAKNFEEWIEKFEGLIKNPPVSDYSGGTASGTGSSSKKDKKNTAPSSQIQIPVASSGNTDSNILKTVDFIDMAGFEWAEEAVKKLASAQIVFGKSDNEFYPRDAITREEFVSILMRAFDIQTESGESVFADVTDGAWYYDAVVTAHKLNLVYGTDSEIFGVGKEITRQEMCVLCYRFARYVGIEFSKETDFPFTDGIADYAREAASALYNSGIVSGVGGNEFLPEASANRAEAARLIYSLLSFAKLI